MQVTAPSHAAHEAKEAAIERLQPFYFKMLKWGSLKAVGLKWRTENWHKNVKALKKGRNHWEKELLEQSTNGVNEEYD